jgi:hypothetical protein
MEASEIENSDDKDIDTEEELQKSICCPYEFTREKIGPKKSLEDVVGEIEIKMDYLTEKIYAVKSDFLALLMATSKFRESTNS